MSVRSKPGTPALFALIAASLLAVSALVVAQPAFSAAAPPPTAAAPVRIMPLGDSITEAPGCWRAYLWDRLQKTGYTNVDFVGTKSSGGCSVPFDTDHEGHSGYSATGIADQNQLPAWLDAARPDVVLMHLGTNDMWGNFRPIDAVIAAYSKLIDQMRADNPNVKILMAKIIPMHCPECTHVVALNNAIPSLVTSKTTAQSPITLVDQWTGFDIAVDTYDGVHPNDAGVRKMADRWYPSLAAVLDGTPTTTTTTTPTTTTTTTPAGTCTATYRVISQWGDGLQGEVSVRNGTTAATSAWTATFDFADGRRITQAWNADVTQNGTTVTARNLTWNGALAPGSTATFGFLAGRSGADTTPAVSCTLG
ncbi:lysophospholipase L1-like esterase [Saccharothrix ecbatanensis]|uniref:Lysophospholipase L1-like esterase n=1 Tax=Saccharothrix ecbatanensis TaxID=1105145 RepID=A0A7W9HF25_9PSEU|nr:cellulose binding domain-containing protein [Saccharothrix ecbatanensis]MBB5801050.1 lysophospholipase L1-like esterase [Saccharothrix ecbatanensis]